MLLHLSSPSVPRGGTIFIGRWQKIFPPGLVSRPRVPVRRFAGSGSPQVEPERVFFLSCPRISADPLRVLNLQDLSAGQFGPLFRCIVASLMTSRRVRCNTRFVAVLGSKEVDETLLNAKSPHLRLELVGDEIKMMYAEEVWVAATFQKAVQRFSDPELGKTWAKSARTAGWRLSHCESVQAAFQDVTHGEQTVTLLLSDTAKEPAEDALQELREESRSCKVSRVVVLLEQLGGQTSHELVASRSVKLAGASSAADDDEEGVKVKTPEEKYSEIANEIATRVPEAFDLGHALRTYPVRYDECLNTVLHMELGKFNRLLVRIKGTCSNLIKAVKGLVVFSPELEAVADGCLTNKIPGPWMGVSYPSLKPLQSYVDDFLLRLKFMNNWIKDGIPYMFWFSAYFFQQAFLTGVLQNFARTDKIAIDRCIWNFEVLKAAFKPEEYPQKGAYINGLFMAGARWDDDNMCIEDSFPKVLWAEMSPVWLKPVEKSDDAHNYDKLYNAPIYKTSERKGVLSTSGHSSNFIMYLAIPHSCNGVHSEEFWTKRGVALISQTDD